MDLSNLNLKIERQKLSLARMAAMYGLEDPRVLAKSRELDELIVEIQRRRLAG